jgi:hypothetical protein
MINARTHNTVSVSACALLAAVARYIAAAALTCWRHVLTAMRESREREAARVIARYRHLSEDAERFYQREKLGDLPMPTRGGEQAHASARPSPLRGKAGARPFHIDPMQGIR